MQQDAEYIRLGQLELRFILDGARTGESMDMFEMTVPPSFVSVAVIALTSCTAMTKRAEPGSCMRECVGLRSTLVNSFNTTPYSTPGTLKRAERKLSPFTFVN